VNSIRNALERERELGHTERKGKRKKKGGVWGGVGERSIILYLERKCHGSEEFSVLWGRKMEKRGAEQKRIDLTQQLSKVTIFGGGGGDK